MEANTNPPKRRVLVVDDNHDAATTLALLLKLTGNEAHTRFDGQAGVEAADSLRPQVVILDISMPGMDGYQACRFIRAQSWGKAMLLIALSGYGQADDVQRSIEAGFDTHLVKPVDLALLKALLASAPHPD
jgi:CheY-like chemotaxis protein